MKQDRCPHIYNKLAVCIACGHDLSKVKRLTFRQQCIMMKIKADNALLDVDKHVEAILNFIFAGHNLEFMIALTAAVILYLHFTRG